MKFCKYKSRFGFKLKISVRFGLGQIFKTEIQPKIRFGSIYRNTHHVSKCASYLSNSLNIWLDGWWIVHIIIFPFLERFLSVFIIIKAMWESLFFLIKHNFKLHSFKTKLRKNNKPRPLVGSSQNNIEGSSKIWKKFEKLFELSVYLNLINLWRKC